MWSMALSNGVSLNSRLTRFLSAARGSYGRPGAVDPAGFPRFIGIMGQVLLPRRNPDLGQDDCRLPTGCD